MKSEVLIAQAAVEALQANFPDLSLAELRVQVKHIEAAIQASVVHAIVEYFSPQKSFRRTGADEFIFRDHLFEVRIASSIDIPTINICILKSDDPSGLRISSGINSISGVGYFNNFEIDSHSLLKSHLPGLVEVVSRIYKATYTWLEEELFKNIKTLETGFADALYRQLRITLGSHGKQALASKVWFSIFSEKNGYYAIDGKAIDQILIDLKRRRYSSKESPLSHAIELIDLHMPYGKSLSRIAIDSGKYMEFSLRKAAYVSDMTGIFKTEEQMVDGGGYGIFPLCSIGDRKLVAAFPSGLRDVLLPIFEDHKKKFEETYVRESSSLKRHISKVQASYRKMDATELGGLIGGIIGGIFKNI